MTNLNARYSYTLTIDLQNSVHYVVISECKFRHTYCQ